MVLTLNLMRKEVLDTKLLSRLWEQTIFRVLSWLVSLSSTNVVNPLACHKDLCDYLIIWHLVWGHPHFLLHCILIIRSSAVSCSESLHVKALQWQKLMQELTLLLHALCEYILYIDRKWLALLALYSMTINRSFLSASPVLKDLCL